MTTIEVTVRCFSLVRNTLDRDEVFLTLPGGATAGDVSDRIRSVYVSALLEQLRREAVEAGEVSDDEVKAYYDANKQTLRRSGASNAFCDDYLNAALTGIERANALMQSYKRIDPDVLVRDALRAAFPGF